MRDGPSGASGCVRGHGAHRGLAEESWVEDNEGSTALVAAGHAVALVPGVLASALRRDVVAVALAEPPRRGIYAMTRAATKPDPAVGPRVEELARLLRAT